MKDNEINLHKDHDDVLTVVLHLEYPTSGGGTVIYNGNTAQGKGNLIEKCKFKHGLIHLRPFCSMLHATEPRRGRRGELCIIYKKHGQFFLIR